MEENKITFQQTPNRQGVERHLMPLIKITTTYGRLSLAKAMRLTNMRTEIKQRLWRIGPPENQKWVQRKT
jgi:hypothetical protein